MKKILVPTDFSKNAYTAMSYAFGVAAATGMELTILHVFHFLIPTNIPRSEYRESVKIGEQEKAEEMKKHLNGFIRDIPGSGKVNFSIKAVYGFAAEKIAAFAKEEKMDIIIMGTKGITGIKKFLMGSVASEVIQMAGCPVMVIPAGVIFHRPKKIVLATDFIEIEDYSIFNALRELAILFDAEITILHVQTEEKKELAFAPGKEDLKIEAIIPDTKHSYHFIHNNNLVEAIENFALSTDADIIAILPREHNFFVRIFGESVTRELIPIIRQPLLALKN